jgi:hypothetical protein
VESVHYVDRRRRDANGSGGAVFLVSEPYGVFAGGLVGTGSARNQEAAPNPASAPRRGANLFPSCRPIIHRESCGGFLADGFGASLAFLRTQSLTTANCASLWGYHMRSVR